MGIRFNARTSAIETDAASIDFSQPITTPASTTSLAGLNIAEGVAPTAPVDGDVWVTAAGAFNARLNGATVDLSAGGGGGTIGGSITDNQIAVGATTADDIEGSASLTFDGTTVSTSKLNLTGTGIRATAAMKIESAQPSIYFQDTGATADEGNWDILVDSDAFAVRTASDADGFGENAFIIQRTGTTVTSTTFNGTLAADNLSGTNTGDEPAASDTVAGIVELATIAETNTGTDATRAVTPDGLDGWTGSAQFTTAGALTATSYDGVLAANLLDKTATETVSGGYTFSQTLTVTGDHILNQSTAPAIWFDETDAAASNQSWLLGATGETFQLRAYDDAFSSSNPVFTVQRTGIVVDSFDFSTAVTATSFTDATLGATGVLYAGTGGIIENDSGNFIWDGTRLVIGGVMQLVERADHAASPAGGRGEVWVKSGSLGGELMYTEGDQDRDFTAYNVVESTYHFDQATTSADPGAGNLRWNNATVGSVTGWYISDTDETGRDNSYMLGNLADGDILILRGMWSDTSYMVASVNGAPTDNTGWWTVLVTLIHSSGRPTTGEPVHIEVEWAGSQAGGDVTKVGTPANNQVGVWTGDGTIEGAANVTYDGIAFEVNTDVIRVTNSEFQNNSGTANVTLSQNWNGTSHEFTFGSAATNWRIEGLTNAAGDTITIADGPTIRIYDPTDSQYFSIVKGSTGTITFDASSSQTITLGSNISTVNYDDTILDQPILRDYAIEADTLKTPVGTTQTLTYSLGPVFDVDLESVTGNLTITLSGGPPTGTHGQVTVKVTQDSAVARTLIWAGGTFRWVGGTAHPMNSTLNGFSIYTFETWDAGTTWWGAGADYS